MVVVKVSVTGQGCQTVKVCWWLIYNSAIPGWWKLEHIYITTASFRCRLGYILMPYLHNIEVYINSTWSGKRANLYYNYHIWKSMIHWRTAACLPVISVQAVNQFRKDPRLNEVIYGRVTVTGQQLPTKTKRKQKTMTHTHSRIALLTHTNKTNQIITEKQLKNVNRLLLSKFKSQLL